MGIPKDLPKELHGVRDAAVAHAISGTPLPKNAEDLMSWLEVNGEFQYEFLTLDLERLASGYFDDNEAKARGDFLEDDVLTDADRVAAAREMIERELSDGDSAFIIGFNIARDDGASAIFFCETHDGGQGGAVYSFGGVYKTEEDAKKGYLQTGLFVDPDAAKIPEGEILKLWRRPKSKPQKNRPKPRKSK